MRRFQLFEIAEQPWCPALIRDALTDYLRAAIDAGRVYAPVVPLLAQAVSRTGDGEVLDLAAGGGGPWAGLLPALDAAGAPIRVRLTDRFPNEAAFGGFAAASDGRIVAERRPVDALAVPADLGGLRTIFSAFHHFPPAAARALLQDAAARGRGVAVFEATRRDARSILLTLLTPLFVLLLTPRIRPFRWSRILLTYVVPIIPLVVLFDGVVSCLRTYTVDEVRELVSGLGGAGYEWAVGEVGDGPIPVTYVVGLPPARAAASVGRPVAERTPASV